MHLFTLSLKQAGILLPFLLSLPINVLASELEPAFELESRGNPFSCCIGLCDDDDSGNEEPTLDGPTSDQSPGIGVEFESGQVVFQSTECSKEETDSSKGAVVGNRQGLNWVLTADTTPDEPGFLVAEYILDGTQIKIGTNAAAPAASAVANDITSWNPSAQLDPNTLNVEGSNCNPWTITDPVDANTPGAANIKWAPQVTAPLPLEAISDLFSKAVASQTSPLLPVKSPARNMVYVTTDFFQSSPYGITSDNVKDDVLGFFSLVVSYAKAIDNTPLFEGESPKELISIMVRTDYTNIFNQVSSAVPATHIYDILKVVACYQNTDNGVELDTNYCTGTTAAPVPNTKMDAQTFTVQPNGGAAKTLLVSDWITSIQNNESPDALTALDKIIDGQVGGLGNALENVLDTSRAVPLFEFRRLQNLVAGDMESRVTDAENAVIAYHKADANLPRFVRRRLNSRGESKYSKVKRQACSPIPTTTSAPALPSCILQNEDPDQGINSNGCICGSTTLPLLTVVSATDQDQSCSYTALPTSSVPNPISIETQTYTSNCQACTVVGGIADTPTCTSIGGCTPTAIATPPPPSVTPTTVPLTDQCIHVFTDAPVSTATCTTSVSQNDLSTPLPAGAWTCITRGFTVCYCEAAGQAEPCEPANEIAAGDKRALIPMGPRPTPGEKRHALPVGPTPTPKPLAKLF